MALTFTPSPRSTVGIEWELALVDAASGELRNVADTVLAALEPTEAYPSITGELLLNTVELVSGAHAQVAAAIDDLRGELRRLRSVTDPLGLDLISAGSHPFATWTEQHVSHTERYRTLIERTQWWGRNMMIWGVHVHVGVESPGKVIPLMRALTAVSPQLQALSASSPFWAGEATGYASNRALMFQQLPTAGLPQHLADWTEFEIFIDDLSRTGVIESVSEVRWDVRPAPRWGTLEFRACDGVSTIEELAALTAYIQASTEWWSTELDAGRPLPALKPWFERENKWRAARYGLDADIILDNAGTEAPIRDEIQRTIERLGPTAKRLGCAEELAAVGGILSRGAGYQRQLATFSRTGDLRAVVSELARELRDGEE